MSDNRLEHISLIKHVRTLEAGARSHSVRAQEKFRRRGQLSPRARLARLIDPGSPVIELSTLAGLGMHDDRASVLFDACDDEALTRKKIQPLGGSGISTIAWVSGMRCVVYVHEASIKGGAMSPMGVKKLLRAQTIALENRLPLVTLAESAGANLRYQSELFIEGGSTFANQARLSAAGIPQLTIVHGSSTAGGAYMPGLSDLVIMVRERAKVFLAGPPLVAAATGERVDEESLGGAEMHGEITGSAEWVAENDREAITMARRWLRRIYESLSAELKATLARAETFVHDPFSQEEVIRRVPVDFTTPYDPRKLLEVLSDDGDFDEFKPNYGSEMVVGLMRCHGRPVAFLSNFGPIQPRGSGKAAQWISIACQRGWPLVFFQNTTGFMVGSEAEQSGIVKRGSALIQAVTNATVPKITFLIGGSFGAGHYAMCGRPFNPRLIFAWPNQRLAVMGGPQAADVFDQIAAKAGVTDERREAQRLSIIEQFDRESSSLFATARLWDDGIIDPRDTRRLLGEALALFEWSAQAERERKDQENHFPLGVARL